MSRKTLDKREKKRLKKVKAEKQPKRMRAAEMMMHGYSLREAAAILGMSHQFIADCAKKLLNKTVITVKGKKIVKYRKKEGAHEHVRTKKPGPASGNCPAVARIKDAVVSVKRNYMKMGAEKIGVMVGVDASAPTVRKALYATGFPPVTVKKGKRYKSFSRPYSNDLWQMDYVELGTNSITGVGYISSR